MDIIAELQWRGLLADCTDLESLAKRLASGPTTLYAGFDPSSDSLHVGNLVPLLAHAMDAISGPYAAAFNHYVREELGYESDLPYEQLTSRVQPWSFKDFEGRPVDVTPKLERAMRANPHLRVHVAHGYYDGATPYFAAEDVFAHLVLPRDLRANIEHRYYESGHMMYVHEPSRLQQSEDLADFVTRASRG